jgi:hypothetical protein
MPCTYAPIWTNSEKKTPSILILKKIALGEMFLSMKEVFWQDRLFYFILLRVQKFCTKQVVTK